jgi:hypothetical protein
MATSANPEVFKYTGILCEVLRDNYIRGQRARINWELQKGQYTTMNLAKLKDLNAGKIDYDFVIEEGNKYLKIIMVINEESRSVHAFVNKLTGELFKAASFNSPAKGIRGYLLADYSRERIYKEADWNGGYLYRR